jgi:hypothetical protein
MEDAKLIRRYLKKLEKQAGILTQLREVTKTDGGRLNDFGKKLVASAKTSKVQQAFVAKLLDISPGAVSQHYSK